MLVLPSLAMLMSTVGAQGSSLGPVSVHIAMARRGGEDLLAIELINRGERPVEFEVHDSPCSIDDLATLAFVGKGAIGLPVGRVGIVQHEVPRTAVIPAHGLYACTFSISEWYQGRWSPKDRSDVRIFWTFTPVEEGIYDRTLYGGVEKLP
jgi:hypothetical protein